MAFSRLSLDDIFFEKIKEKPKRREKKEYLALRRTKAMDVRKFLDEALDKECQKGKSQKCRGQRRNSPIYRRLIWAYKTTQPIRR